MPNNVLDDLAAIKNLDTGNMLGSLEELAAQFQQTWDEIKTLSFAPRAPIHHVVVSGLGGSALGADLARSVFKDRLTVPIEISRDYTIPQFINENTLVILASYSGTTEETLTSLSTVEAHHSQIMAIATGGQIIDYARDKGHTFYQIKPDHNPGGQARTAIGYSLLGTLGLLHLAGVLPDFSDQEVKEIILTILSQEKLLAQTIPTISNPAKLLALELVDRRPVLLGADFTEGALHTATNCLNENSKVLADYKVIPEMNHHWLEGLYQPPSNNHDTIFLLIRSALNHPRNQKRLDLNQELFEKFNFANLDIELTSETKLTQAFELICLFAYASFYLAILLGIDPSPTDNVNWLKSQLG